MKKKLLFLLFLFFSLRLVFAADGFVVKKIQITGLQGIQQSTVLNYVPLKIGDKFTAQKSTDIISALYKTNFFDSIVLSKSGNTLIIAVKQRSIIGQIQITGNKTIPGDKLKEVLKKAGLYEGKIFNQAILHQIKYSLQQQYILMGHYNAKVSVDVILQPRKRVAIKINVNEGSIAKIKAINIIGNNAFGERVLLKQFQLSPTGIFSYFTKSDRYSKERLEQDLQSLSNFYLDHGFLKFKVISKNVKLSDDNSKVIITINVAEGSQYKISGYKISGTKNFKGIDIAKYIDLENGKYFSRKKIVAIDNNIMRALGNVGYANAAVNAIPKINSKDSTVFLTFSVRPGPMVYVRHITFSGNTNTNDEVLRRAVEQKEGAPFSAQKIEESKTNILTLPSQSVQNVEVTTMPASGKSNQVDVNYKVTEISTAKIGGGVSYSELEKFSINAQLTQNNWLGAGKTLAIAANLGHVSQSINFDFYNPYYTRSGVGRHISFHTSTFNGDKANITSYATDIVGASIGYTIPVSNKFSWSAGYGAEYNHLRAGTKPSTQATNFINKYGDKFYQLYLTAGWTYQGLDRVVFPTDGLHQSFGGVVTIPIGSKSLEYYTLNYTATYFHPIYKGFIGNMRFNTGYGDGYGKYDTLPFFKNFYAGGIGTVRGYDGSSLGPKDSNNDPLGGKFLIDGSLNLILPNYFSDKVRTSLFVDAGNVYDHISLSSLRLSTGVEIDWRAPIALLNFSFAKAINPRAGDSPTVFNFGFGSNF